MTESEKWDALRKTALSDHEPFCNYGQTNGREMCTCQILVDLVEGTDDEKPTFRGGNPSVAGGGHPVSGTARSGVRQPSSDARKARLARQRAAKASRASRAAKDS